MPNYIRVFKIVFYTCKGLTAPLLYEKQPFEVQFVVITPLLE